MWFRSFLQPFSVSIFGEYIGKTHCLHPHFVQVAIYYTLYNKFLLTYVISSNFWSGCFRSWTIPYFFKTRRGSLELTQEVDLSLLFSALLAWNNYCLKPGTSKCLLSFDICNYFLLRKQISSCLSRWIPYPSASFINRTNIKTSDKNCSLQKVTLQLKFQVKTIYACTVLFIM